MRGQAHTVYARLVAENDQYIAAEFHYLMALAAVQSAVEAGNPLVLLARQVFPNMNCHLRSACVNLRTHDTVIVALLRCMSRSV